MAQDWTVQALGATPPGPVDERRAVEILSAVLALAERAVAARTDRPGPLRWHDGEVVRDDIRDPAALADLVRARRERHDDGEPVSGAASVGDLRGHLGTTGVVGVSWELDGEHAPDTVRIRVDAATLGELQAQDRHVLVQLLTEVAEAVEAPRAQITTRALARALGREGLSLAAGALMLLPRDAVAVDVPAGCTLVGRVLVADLHAVAVDPAAVVQALAPVDRLLAVAAPGGA